MFVKVLGTGSRGNCYALFEKNDIFLLDCGLPYRQILTGIGYKIGNVRAVLVTHEHSDHALAIKDFIRYGVKVYGPPAVAEKHPGVVALQQKKRNRIGNILVVPFELPHDGCMNFGYYIQFSDKNKLLYATDFEYIPAVFKNDNIENFLIECNHIDDYIDRSIGYLEHSVRGHSSLKTIEDFLNINVNELTKNIILCHLSQNQCDPKVCYDAISKIITPKTLLHIATPGMVIDLSKEANNE